MASGKQTPRQKMINLMYLVFIAMMALNMSKEVLTAFGLMNEKLDSTAANFEERNTALMAGLKTKVEEQPQKYTSIKADADKIDELSTELNQYIAGIKEKLEASVDDATDYETMDKSNTMDEMFFQSGRISPEGEEFLNKIKAYREGVSAILSKGYPAIAKKVNVEKEFSTEPVNVEGANVPWLKYRFEGFPLVASITQLTQMQSDIKSTESEILSNMLSGQLQSDVSLDNYEAIVIPSKPAFFSGENFSGKVVLGRFDNTLQFENVVVNGKEVKSLKDGQVVLDFPAGNVGEQKINGKLEYLEDGETKEIPIDGSYTVIPLPNSAVISADKMNVVYRGVQNPMTISIPGVSNVNANAPGLRSAGGTGNYLMDVTTLQAREVTISVSGTLPGGKTVSDKKTFRVKDIPRPVGTIRGEDGSVSMQRNSLEIASVGANLPDFDFDLNLNVTGFKFKVPGQPTIIVNGSRLDDRAKAALRRAGRGESVQIFDIEASLAGNSSYKLKKVAPVVIELTN
ncbi:gliding motility protein GldM [Christiangramia salexigens]|uniref:Gliding motility protein GldM n=1 Tax=Christiangramia salexigens TaxID=1913577 RepID=A0A1L3J7C1_9FLAO|nr:gliding motility protein GldM [Christiangramia salexigens]APG61019.1 gliding motility protein GldM [Christiangramia salexigens]